MENKILVLFFILIEAVILAFCETNSFDSFASRLNGKTDIGNLDISKLKNFRLFDSNTLVPEGKNIAKKPTAFNEGYSQSADAVNSLEISEDISKTNFSEKQNEISEFHQNGYNNWQKEINPFYPKRQESAQDTPIGQTLNKRINPQTNNEWGRGGNFFHNSQSRWNEEENYKQYQTARNGDNFDRRTAMVPNIGKPVVNSDIQIANGFGKPFFNNRGMNEYFPPKNEENEKVSLTLLNDEEVKSINKYDYESFQNRFKNQLNSKIHYDRHADGFRTANYHNPEKGVIINFNTECSTTKPYTNPIFHKFIFTTKPQNPQVEVPTYHIPEPTLYTRQVSTPICYL